VIGHSAFPAEPWCLRETSLDLSMLAQTESLFSLSNGHLGLRGNLDEGEPNGLSGTYVNSVFEERPLPYAEAGYGDPESGQTVVNVTNGKIIRLLVDDEPFDVRYGRLLMHERVLDLRAGVLRRTAEWQSPAGRRVRIRSTRLVSLTQRAVAAIRYELEVIDRPVRIVLQSELVANEDVPTQEIDPRAAAVLRHPLESEQHDASGTRAVLIHRTRRSGLRIAAGMDHVLAAPADVELAIEATPDLARLGLITEAQPGEVLSVVKLLAYGRSSVRSRPALNDQICGALAAARATGWDDLLTEQRTWLDGFWEDADVLVEGDDAVQQAVRVALFHVLQAAVRAEGRPIPAKGLTGTGYDGHAFWDTETFVLPVLTYTAPAPVADALRWRHATLPAARARARQLGLAGAAFPWRTIDGRAASAYWPAGTAAFHINAGVAAATVGYVEATGDEDFACREGLELLIETARLWRSLGHVDGEGWFRIDGVTGPDEYSAVADNNVYTNLMAQANLRAAAAAVLRWRERAAELGADADEAQSWADAAEAMFIPYDERLGVHEQSEGFTKHEPWDFEATRDADYPLLLHFPYFQLYRKQVVKQADLVLAMHLRGDAFTTAQKTRNFDYYERITVRDSSLSACTQAVLAAELGYLDLAYAYLREAALMDLDDLEQNTRDGLHLASLAGAWIALVMGFGGLRTHGGVLSFTPRLPSPLSRLHFNVRWHGARLGVNITGGRVSYELLDGSSVRLRHEGESIELIAGAGVTLPLADIEPRLAPLQPRGRGLARPS
jgi:alpha,alpha-trehalose phosphorylase